MSKNTYKSGMESIYSYLRQIAIKNPIRVHPLAIKDAASSTILGRKNISVGEKIYIDHIVGIAASNMTSDGKISVLIPPYCQAPDHQKLTFIDYEELVSGESLKFHEKCECGRCQRCKEKPWILENQ